MLGSVLGRKTGTGTNFPRQNQCLSRFSPNIIVLPWLEAVSWNECEADRTRGVPMFHFFGFLGQFLVDATLELYDAVAGVERVSNSPADIGRFIADGLFSLFHLFS